MATHTFYDTYFVFCLDLSHFSKTVLIPNEIRSGATPRFTGNLLVIAAVYKSDCTVNQRVQSVPRTPIIILTNPSPPLSLPSTFCPHPLPSPKTYIDNNYMPQTVNSWESLPRL